MTTPTPDDPFAQTPSQLNAGVQPGSAPSAPPPPPLPGQAPPPGAFAPAGWAPERPTALAMTAIALTGAYTLLQLVSAFTAQGAVDNTKAMLASGETSIDAMGTLLQLLVAALGIASFVLLALWMSRIRSNLDKRGVTAGGPPHVEWWGWFVPLANFVLPLLGMKAIAHRKVGMGLLMAWWLPWCLVWIVSTAAQVTSTLALDFSTGELANPDLLDASVPLTYIATLATVVSWASLVVIIRRVTARHLED